MGGTRRFISMHACVCVCVCRVVCVNGNRHRERKRIWCDIWVLAHSHSVRGSGKFWIWCLTNETVTAMSSFFSIKLLLWLAFGRCRLVSIFPSILSYVILKEESTVYTWKWNNDDSWGRTHGCIRLRSATINKFISPHTASTFTFIIQCTYRR